MSEWVKAPVVDIFCGACAQEGRSPTRLAQIEMRDDGLWWHARGKLRTPAAQRHEGLGRDSIYEAELLLEAERQRKHIYSVVCWRHGKMTAPRGDVDRAIRGPSTRVRVFPSHHGLD